MIELTVSDVRWSREHGHPVLVMSVEGESAGALSIVLSPTDAQLLSAKPVNGSAERLRLITLIEAMATALGARLSEIRFRLDAGMVLTADLLYESGLRKVAIPANFADAIVLAERTKTPMLISDRDLRWIRALQEPPQTSRGDHQPAETLTASMTSFIESLKLDDLHGPRGDANLEA